jgi:signal peptidase I
MRKFIGLLLIVVSLFAIAAIALGQTSSSFSLANGVPAQGPEQVSPADRVDSENIAVMANGVLIKGLTNVRLVNLADTNSMDPVLDVESTAIEITPKSADELYVGDIVSYQSGSNTIIHRIISVGSDGEWYAITKGDNNAVSDPEKVRFEQVKGVVVGIVY